MQTYYLLYKITNTVNGKIYIGVHKTTDVDDSYMGSGSRLAYAKRKYGLESFTREIIKECSSHDEMMTEEAKIVDEEFLKRKDVYNLRRGGAGSWVPGELSKQNMSIATKGHKRGVGRKCSEETKQKLREANLGNQSAKGCKRSDEFKEALSKAHMGNQYAKGIIRSEEFKQKLSTALTGRVFSEEARRKMSEAKKRNQNAKRQKQS